MKSIRFAAALLTIALCMTALTGNARRMEAKVLLEGPIPEYVSSMERLNELEEGMEKNRLYRVYDKLILLNNCLGYEGRSAVFFGDSLTAGIGNREEDGGDGRTWPQIFSKLLGYGEIVNLSCGGATYVPFWEPNLFEQLDVAPDTADAVFVMAGYNDFYTIASTLQSPEDTGLEDPEEESRVSFYGAVNYFFLLLKEKYPDTRIYVLLPPQNYSESYYAYDPYPEDNVRMARFMEIIRERAEAYEFRVLDIYEEGFLDSSADDTREALYHDVIHPNGEGYEYLAMHIAALYTAARYEELKDLPAAEDFISHLPRNFGTQKKDLQNCRSLQSE